MISYEPLSGNPPDAAAQLRKAVARLPFRRIYLSPEAEDLPAARRALERLPGLPVHSAPSREGIPEEHRSRETLFITRPRGGTVGRCPGSRGHLCCNYLTVDIYLGCSLGCSYCIMKSYLNFEPLVVHADPGPAVERIRGIARDNPDRMIRVGSGETGDSLELDPIFGLTEEFIRGLADLPNVRFEAKTKTVFVDHLLDIPDKGGAVMAFSLNAREVQQAEEGEAASIDERLRAAERAVRAGYMAAFHFDPVIAYPDWREGYGETIGKLGRFPADRVAWISLGTFRYPPALKDRMDRRPYLYDEFVPCRDGKYRYLQRRRGEIYTFMKKEISGTLDVPVYLCMESSDIWRRVYGDMPLKMRDMHDIFTIARNADPPADSGASPGRKVVL